MAKYEAGQIWASKDTVIVLNKTNTSQYYTYLKCTHTVDQLGKAYVYHPSGSDVFKGLTLVGYIWDFGERIAKEFET